MTVDLYAFDWQKGPRQGRDRRRRTPAAGSGSPRPPAAAPISCWPRKGRDIAFDPDYLYLQTRTEPREERRRPRLHGPLHLPARPEALLEGPGVQGTAGPGPHPPRCGNGRHRLARGHQQPARRPGHGLDEHVRHGQRRVRHPGRRPAAGPLAPCGPRRTAPPRCASRNTSARPSRSRSRTRRNRCA